MLIILAFVIAFFFAINIGASGAAAAMGVSYGSGAIKRPWIALCICAVGVFLGAYIGGGEVVKTIGSGIVPASILKVEIVLIILASATLSLFMANIIGIPLSTSEVTVGAVVGAGIAYRSVYVDKLLWIMLFWVLVPVAAFLITYLLSRLLPRLHLNREGKKGKVLAYCVIAAGFFEAFSAGMNNVANSVGPLVGAGLISVSSGIFWGGLFVSLGALLLGKKVLETNGKKITRFSVGEGIVISTTGATLVTISSVFGLPVPLTQVTSSSIIGIGAAKSGFHIWQKRVVIQMLKVWIVSPIVSLVISYGLVALLLKGDFYAFVVLISSCLATVGVISLMRTIKEEKEVFSKSEEKVNF